MNILNIKSMKAGPREPRRDDNFSLSSGDQRTTVCWSLFLCDDRRGVAVISLSPRPSPGRALCITRRTPRESRPPKVKTTWNDNLNPNSPPKGGDEDSQPGDDEHEHADRV